MDVKSFEIFRCLLFGICFCMPKTRKELKNAIKGNQIFDLKEEKTPDLLSPDQVFATLTSILNRFIFSIFLIFISTLNLMLIVVFPITKRV